jgi:hypothetical protein
VEIGPSANDIARKPDWPANEASPRFKEMKCKALSAAIPHRIATRLSRITMDDDVECLKLWGERQTGRRKNNQTSRI